MKQCLVRLLLALSLFVTAHTPINAQQPDPEKLPPARNIPGLTAPDSFPGGCVDCHINMPERKQDERLSILMAQWRQKVRPELLMKAQAVAPAGIKLKGMHPASPKALESVPNNCKLCHTKESKMAPPLAALIHTIHLTGEQNQFLTTFQGECTHCHKFAAATGSWNMPSGPEK